MVGFVQPRTRFGETGVILAVLFGAFAAALLVTAVTGRFSSPERWEYSEIAENLIQGRGAFRQYLGTKYYFYGPAAYPILLAGTMWMGKRYETIIVILQSVLFALTCGIIYLTARSIFGTKEAVIAGVLGALHPGALIYAGKLHSQTLDVFLIVLSFWLLLRIGAISSLLGAGGAGLVAGLAALSRGTVVPFYSLWGVWFLWRERKRLFRAVLVVLTVAVGGALVIVPVLARGYVLYGELIPLRTDTGVNLWYGNHPGASGTSYTLSLSPVPVISQRPAELSARLAGLNEVDQNKVFTKAALEFVRDHPAAAASLFLKKLYYFWWFPPHAGLLYPAKWTMAYKVYYSIVLFFAVAGLLVSMRSALISIRTAAYLFLLMAGSVSATQALFYVEGRHRWQVEPLLLMFTAAGFLYCLRYFNKSSSTTAPAVNTTC